MRAKQLLWSVLLLSFLPAEEPPFAPLDDLWSQSPETALTGEARRFARADREASPALPGVRLHFANGERLGGELLSLTPERLELRAPWGQDLLSDVRNLREIDFLPSENRLLLDGPAALTEWRTDYPGKPPPWRIGNELSSHAELYNVVCARLPGVEGPLELLIRLRPGPGIRNWGLHLFNPEAGNRRGRDSLNLAFDGRRVELFVNQDLFHMSSGGTQLLPEDPGPVREIRLRVHRGEQRVQLVVDGHLVHDLRHESVARFRSDVPFWLHIQPHQSGIMTVEELRLVKSTAGLLLPVPTEIRERPLMILRNGDQLPADIRELRDGRIRLSLPQGAELSLPATSVARILFPANPAPAPAAPPLELNSGPARARLLLGNISWDNKTLRATSRNFTEPLRIPLDLIDSVGWHPRHD